MHFWKSKKYEINEKYDPILGPRKNSSIFPLLVPVLPTAPVTVCRCGVNWCAVFLKLCWQPLFSCCSLSLLLLLGAAGSHETVPRGISHLLLPPAGSACSGVAFGQKVLSSRHSYIQHRSCSCSCMCVNALLQILYRGPRRACHCHVAVTLFCVHAARF